jgi:single-strand selective monofunctional uracil DNA glycosylase
MSYDHRTIIDALLADLNRLTFRPPTAVVYNPLDYARAGYEAYLNRFGAPPRAVILLGMNPGPWGMAQTGVPFGDVASVSGWLGIREPIGQPVMVHPKRPVDGFACRRREISGHRLWGWARAEFGTPDRFFSRFFVANYCPLMFVEKSGRNITPDKLPMTERKPLLEACDRALGDLIAHMTPKWVIGIGTFAARRIESVLSGAKVTCGRITHPSPANPKANRGWADRIRAELTEAGIYW